ncbi:substrate-binding domain-containing protein [Paenibacillus aquistagni]|uniref:substrate-binding domain-containing protein n=1 Tax=Paenibacillus aquistagni TaxID=1852522 RepID=UPI000B501F9A|nr:substrate-binding domain-containing protein [Paenibacillus aquistagni]
MSKQKWVIGLVVLLSVFGLALYPFLSSSLAVSRLVDEMGARTNPEDKQSESMKNVVLIAQELDNPFWRMIEEGAKQRAALSNMEIQYVGPIRINAEEQLKLLEKAIASKPDAILAQGINDPTYNELVSKAMDQGIPVVTVDSDAPSSRRLAYVGTDNLEAGKRMGELVLSHAELEGKIGVIIGSEQAYNQKLRLEGFESVMAEHPDYEVVDVRSSNISRIEAARQAQEMLRTHPDLTAMIGFSAWDAVGMVEALQSEHREVRVFGFDDVEATKRAIAEGKIAASLVQQPREIGATAVAVLQQIFEDKPFPATAFTSTQVIRP